MKYTLHYFDSLESTNNTAQDTKYSAGDVIVADFQSAGRGQRGNTWHSLRGENLTLSLIIEPSDIHASHQFLISEVTALAVAKTIEDFGIQNVEIKWPNDILVSGQKIAGILIEHTILGSNIARSIIGVGLNVSQRNFPPLDTNPTSLFLLGALSTTRDEVLHLFLQNFSEFYALMSSPEELSKLYSEKLYRLVGFFPYLDCLTNENFLAEIHSIDPLSGELVLHLKDNSLKSYFFKEVRFL